MLLSEARLLSSALVSVLGIALCTGCSSGGHGRTSPPPDPSTTAQINARLLVAGTAPGFLLEAHASITASRSAHAQPFVPPTGTPNQACTQLAAPELFRPTAVLDTGEYIGVADARRYGLLPPAWFEYIDVYPATQAAGLVKTLSALIGRCGHFQFTFPGSKPLPATEVAAPMRGLGSQALYVTVRVAVQPGAFQVLDWVVIRADRTLIWIVDQSGISSVGTGRDALTLRLAEDAWRHYQTE